MKIHQLPMPKNGGTAMILGSLISIIFWAPSGEFVRAVLIGVVVISIFGLIDDMKDLGFKTKFTGQFAAALLIIIYGGVKIKSLGMLIPNDVLLPDWLAILKAIAVL